MSVSLRTLLDAGVPDPVGEALEESGHLVIYHRDVLPERTPDQVVAATALANGAILVALDHDMKQMAQRYGMTARGDRFARLSLIRLCCDETLAPKRLRHAMSFVEHEWSVTEKNWHEGCGSKLVLIFFGPIGDFLRPIIRRPYKGAASHA